MLLFAAQGLAAGQDALRGKRLYYDISALTPAPVSCVECHGAYPGAVHGIGRAANEPHAIRYALGAIPQMARLGEHLSAQDIADIAAYLGAPDVPSPQLVLVSDGPGADHGAQGRLEIRFSPNAGVAYAGMTLQNRGAAPVRLRSGPVISGLGAAHFRLRFTDCTAGRVLARGGSCRFEVALDPDAPTPAPVATLSIAHDWLYGGERVALIGRVAERAGDKTRPSK